MGIDTMSFRFFGAELKGWVSCLMSYVASLGRKGHGVWNKCDTDGDITIHHCIVRHRSLTYLTWSSGDTTFHHHCSNFQGGGTKVVDEKKKEEIGKRIDEKLDEIEIEIAEYLKKLIRESEDKK
jgi:hypothetical protein